MPRTPSSLFGRRLHARHARRLLGAGLLTAAAALGGPVALGEGADAHVGKREGLSFRDGRPLKLSLDQATHGLKVEVCNLDGAPADGLKASLLGFGFTRDGEAATDREVWADTEAPVSLAAGECGELLVQTKNFRSIDAGDYAGVLTVTSAGHGRAVRSITVAGPAAKAEATIAAPGDAVTFTAKRNGPIGSVSLDDSDLPLTSADADEETLELPKPDTLVGTVIDGTDVGSVYVDGKPKRHAKKGYVLLPLRVEGIDHVGDYAGTLNLAPGAAKPQAVKVTVKVTDSWWWAVGAVLLAVGLALLVQVVLRRCVVKHNLNDRLTALPDSYAGADKRFHEPSDPKSPAPYKGITRPDANLTSYVDEVNQAIADDMASSWFFDPASDAYKSIVASIGAAEDDASFLGSPKGLRKRLDDLSTELADLKAALKDAGFKGDRSPALVEAAKALLAPGELTVGEALARGDSAKEYVALLPRFEALALKQSGLERWAAALEDAPDSGWTPFEREQLLIATATVVEAKNELLSAADAATFDALGTMGDLDHAYGILAALGGRHGIPAPPPPPERDLRFYAMVEGLALPFGPLLSIFAGHAAELRTSLGYLGDRAILLITLVTAVFGTLVTFYFGKTWGTTVDYLTIILAGTGSQVIITALGDTATKLTVGTRTATVASEPTPAEVTPTVAVKAPAG